MAHQQKQQQQETSIPEGDQVASFTSSHWRGHLASQVSAIPTKSISSLPKLNDQEISSSRIQKDEWKYSILLKPSKLTRLGPGAKVTALKELNREVQGAHLVPPLALADRLELLPHS